MVKRHDNEPCVYPPEKEWTRRRPRRAARLSTSVVGPARLVKSGRFSGLFFLFEQFFQYRNPIAHLVIVFRVTKVLFFLRHLLYWLQELRNSPRSHLNVGRIFGRFVEIAEGLNGRRW